MIELKLVEADQGMDWLQFWSSAIGAVAWPLAATVIAFMFRRPIAAILDKVQRLSFGDATLDLSEKLTEIEAVASLDLTRVSPLEVNSDADLPAEPPAINAEPEPLPAENHPPDLPGAEEGASVDLADAAEDRWRQDQHPPHVRAANESGFIKRYASAMPKIRTTSGDDVTRWLHNYSASGRIIAAWELVVARLLELEGSSNFIWAPEGGSLDFLLGTLFGRGRISARHFNMLREMSLVRQAAGRGDASEMDALRFNNLSRQILEELGSVP